MRRVRLGGSASVVDVYKAILDGKQVPLVHLTPEQRQELDAAEDCLFDAGRQPSLAYQQYERCQLAYLEAPDGYETAVVTHENGGPPVPPQLKEQLVAGRREVAERGTRARGRRGAGHGRRLRGDGTAGVLATPRNGFRRLDAAR